jgi:hypothetical protein
LNKAGCTDPDLAARARLVLNSARPLIADGHSPQQFRGYEVRAFNCYNHIWSLRGRRKNWIADESLQRIFFTSDKLDGRFA